MSGSEGGVAARNRSGGRLLTGSKPLREPPSIPSKYQTYVIVNNEKKGFNSRSCRFSDYDYITENPGPGSYTQKVSQMSNFDQKTSWSKKGLGSFASSTKRFQASKSGSVAVGPGSYDYKRPSSDFNRSATSAFHKPISVGKRPQELGPPPNQYNPAPTYRTAPAACASFKSRTRRDAQMNAPNSYPAPGSYEVKDDVIKSTVNPMSSVFKSRVRRELKELNEDVPGPGAYDPHDKLESDATPFYRLHYLAISAPAMPLPKAKPNPGPGHYDIVNYQGPKKSEVASANFLSTLPRGTALEPYKHISPGPAAYKPGGGDKHSFIYNFKGRWI